MPADRSLLYPRLPGARRRSLLPPRRRSRSLFGLLPGSDPAEAASRRLCDALLRFPRGGCFDLDERSPAAGWAPPRRVRCGPDRPLRARLHARLRQGDDRRRRRGGLPRSRRIAPGCPAPIH